MFSYHIIKRIMILLLMGSPFVAMHAASSSSSAAPVMTIENESSLNYLLMHQDGSGSLLRSKTRQQVPLEVDGKLPNIFALAAYDPTTDILEADSEVVIDDGRRTFKGGDWFTFGDYSNAFYPGDRIKDKTVLNLKRQMLPKSLFLKVTARAYSK